MNEGPAGGSDREACTAVLMTVPVEIARRLEAFLVANGVACRIRPTELSGDELAEQALRTVSPRAAAMLDSPAGRLFKGRLRRDLRAEIEIHGSGFSDAYDVLVRPEDLPPDLAPRDQLDRTRSEPVGTPGDAVGVPGERAGGGDPWARPGELAATPPGSVGVVSPLGGLAELCQLPWEQAWALVERLAAAGVPATVLEGEAGGRDVPIAQRIVPVGVQPENLERAKGLLEG